MQDANSFNKELIEGLVLEFHKGTSFILSEVDRRLDRLQTDMTVSLKSDMEQLRLDLTQEFKFELNQLDTKLTRRFDELDSRISTKIDRVDKELSSFRKDTNGQLLDIRSSLLRTDEKLWDHEERLLNLERS